MFNLATLTTAALQDERNLAAYELGAYGPGDVHTAAYQRIVRRLEQIDSLLRARRAVLDTDDLPLAA